MRKLLILIPLFLSCEGYNPNSRENGCGEWRISGTNDDNWSTDVKIDGADSIQWVNPQHIKMYRDGRETDIYAERIKVEFYKCEE